VELETLSSVELDHAARIVVSTALGLGPHQRLVVIADAESAPMAAALARAAFALRGTAAVSLLDEQGARPHPVVPDAVIEQLVVASASAFVASADPRELGMRQHLLHMTRSFGLRHAHMPGVSRRAFARGIRMDYRTVQVCGKRLLGRLERARVIDCRSAQGTCLTIRPSKARPWFAQLGVLEPGRWGNLPAGALYASPEDVSGTFVANASLGEFFGAREGLLTRKPVRIEIRDGRVMGVRALDCPALQRDLEAMLAVSPSSARVGLVAVGVNSGIGSPTGEALVDQNLPGLHLAIGDPAARVTGADWSAPTSFAACQADSTVVIDGAIAIDRGRLLTPA
jgi:leucyl aminopeptidase (aminopeptidase T)